MALHNAAGQRSAWPSGIDIQTTLCTAVSLATAGKFVVMAMCLHGVTRSCCCRLGRFTQGELGALASLYKHFQTASMDFIDLFGIDFGTEMQCKCDRPCLDITLDGTTVSCQSSNLHMYNPWAAAPDCEELQWGSKFGDRVYISAPKCRLQLRSFAASGRAGITDSDFDELLDSLATVETADVCAIVEEAAQELDDERGVFYTCRRWAIDILHSLGSDASACVLIRPTAKRLVQQFIKHGACSWGSPDEELLAHAYLPMLWKLCHHASCCHSHAGADPAADRFPQRVCGFLNSLLKVRVSTI